MQRGVPAHRGCARQLGWRASSSARLSYCATSSRPQHATAVQPLGASAAHDRPDSSLSRSSRAHQQPHTSRDAAQASTSPRVESVATSSMSQPQHAKWQSGGTALTVALATAASVGLALLLPSPGHCSETLSQSSLAAFQTFLDYVESLGSAGPIVFIITVMVFEMVPLFPTQPLSIASGLLFGPVAGTLSVLVGVTLAANNAFLVSRGVGRKLAEKVIVMEMSEDHGHGVVAKKLAEVQHTIRTGGFWKQLTAVTLLRLTPVVPFSASNYVLGLTPVQLPAYLGGTVVGMSVWSLLYASLGAASRELLDGGVDLGDLFADLAERASRYSSVALSVTVGAAVLGLVVYGASRMAAEPASSSDTQQGSSHNTAAEAAVEESPVLQPAERVNK